MLIIIAMLLYILAFDFSSFDITSKKTWLFIAAIMVIIATIAAIIAILIGDNNKSNHSN